VRRLCVRKYWTVGAVIAASLGLAACGTSPATFNSAVSSLSSSPDAEIHLTATASGPGTAQAQPYLSAISLDATYVNPTGASLSDATSLNAEVTVNIDNSALVDLRTIGGNLYVLINASALKSLPSLPISASDLSAVDALFGGRWFELPKSLLNSYLKAERAKLKAAGATPPATTKEVNEEKSIVAALTKFIETTPSTTLSGGGFSETASLQAFVTALWPTVMSLDPSSTAKPTGREGLLYLDALDGGLERHRRIHLDHRSGDRRERHRGAAGDRVAQWRDGRRPDQPDGAERVGSQGTARQRQVVLR
jgi:hypothetical protein